MSLIVYLPPPTRHANHVERDIAQALNPGRQLISGGCLSRIRRYYVLSQFTFTTKAGRECAGQGCVGRTGT